ncbi:hypothetical protein SAY87_016090 [Trapa incisa]|uniref:F-box domain-containing protein n=1 Tax=Trapa incisa TaxID=236973 RepID=A0AAN7L9D4_9MYRT|nr:hypothetical protein SAY87_016090 [Trapa incisa]
MDGSDSSYREMGAVLDSPLHGDVLDLILSHVPLVDLVPASHVSRSWSSSVASSLHHLNRPKPWLVVHTQGRRSNSTVAVHAYDPRSGIWVKVVDLGLPTMKHFSAIRSSNSSLMYALSPSRLSFSVDPLNLTWHHVAAPSIWRVDPVVALVGSRIVVAGGACDFEDDPLSVETFDLGTSVWSACRPMPSILKDSSASTWLSVAVDQSRMYVMEKGSGVTYSYDPERQEWSGPYDLKPDESVYHSVIVFSGDKLILVGLTGSAENFKSLKLWGVRSDLQEVEEIAEIPAELGEDLKGQCSGVPSIAVCAGSDFMYIHSPSRPENVVWYDMAAATDGVDCRSKCEWGSVRNAAMTGMERMVFTCASVGVAELEAALAAGNRRFKVKERSPLLTH